MTLTICFCFPVPKVWSFFFFFHFTDFGVYAHWCHAHWAVMPTQTQLNGQGQEQIAFRIYALLKQVQCTADTEEEACCKLRTPEPALGHMDGHRR